jgi:hypothetical protein
MRTFEKFIIYDVLPSMNPFPGPRSVFILDNCRIHKSQLLYRIARFSVTVIFVAVAVNFFVAVAVAFTEVARCLNCMIDDKMGRNVVHRLYFSCTDSTFLECC